MWSSLKSCLALEVCWKCGASKESANPEMCYVNLSRDAPWPSRMYALTHDHDFQLCVELHCQIDEPNPYNPGWHPSMPSLFGWMQAPIFAGTLGALARPSKTYIYACIRGSTDVLDIHLPIYSYWSKDRVVKQLRIRHFVSKTGRSACAALFKWVH